MHRVLRIVAPFDPKIEKTLCIQRRRTPQQYEEEVRQQIEGITIERPFKVEITKNEANRQVLRDFALPGTQGSQTSIA